MCSAAIIGATIVLALMMEGLAPMMVGGAMKPAALICAILGWDNSLLWVAEIIHYGLGVLVFPIGFVIVSAAVPMIGKVTMGLLWGAVLWLLAMAVVAPMAGVPAFLGGGQMMVASLLAHTVYGLVLGWLYQRSTA